MNRDNHTLDARVARLEQTAAAHDQRLTVLEKKLDPKTQEEHSKLALELLLAELEGLTQDNQGKEVTGVYIVNWCDREGNEQVRRLRNYSDAYAEATDLAKQYDGVRITRPDGSCIHIT